MLDTASPEYKKQLKYIKDGVIVTPDGDITILALGGFAPTTSEKDLIEFYKVSPPFTIKPDTAKYRQIKFKKAAETENEARMSILGRANIFLATLGNTGCSVKRACNISGLNRMAAEGIALRSPEFKQLWDSIYEDVTDELEEAGFKRAVHGVKEPVFYQGEKCGEVTKYSDSTLQFMLQGRRSKVYGKKNTSVTATAENGQSGTKTKIIMGFEEDKTL